MTQSDLISKIQLDVKFDRNVSFDLYPWFSPLKICFPIRTLPRLFIFEVNIKLNTSLDLNLHLTLTSIEILISNFNGIFILEGSFPHRILETGQKYHGTNGLVRDEFSSPFHWETQSQMETFYIMDPIEIPGKNLENSKHFKIKNQIKSIFSRA